MSNLESLSHSVRVGQVYSFHLDNVVMLSLTVQRLETVTLGFSQTSQTAAYFSTEEFVPQFVSSQGLWEYCKNMTPVKGYTLVRDSSIVEIRT